MLPGGSRQLTEKSSGNEDSRSTRIYGLFNPRPILERFRLVSTKYRIVSTFTWPLANVLNIIELLATNRVIVWNNSGLDEANPFEDLC